MRRLLWCFCVFGFPGLVHGNVFVDAAAGLKGGDTTVSLTANFGTWGITYGQVKDANYTAPTSNADYPARQHLSDSQYIGLNFVQWLGDRWFLRGSVGRGIAEMSERSFYMTPPPSPMRVNTSEEVYEYGWEGGATVGYRLTRYFALALSANSMMGVQLGIAIGLFDAPTSVPTQPATPVGSSSKPDSNAATKSARQSAEALARVMACEMDVRLINRTDSEEIYTTNCVGNEKMTFRCPLNTEDCAIE